MPRAMTRIKFGTPPEKKPDGVRDKSHLSVVQPGENVPKGATDGMTAERKAAVTDEGAEEFSPSFDPDDNESYAGEDAAIDSRLMAPDNPDRPSSIPGEDSWKVSDGGIFGRNSGPFMSSDENARRAQAIRDREVNEQKARTAPPALPKGGRGKGKTGQSSGQSPQGDDDKK